ncbi:MAG: peptidoglycan DD-metalloendopeptidase family protein [Polyangia bacterium]
MRIVPATCPVCATEYDPLRARATLVIDGKVRAYCSNPCKEKASRPAPELPIADVGDDDNSSLPTLPSVWSRMSWKGAVAVGASGLAVLLFGGKLIGTAPLASASIAPPRAPVVVPTAADAMAMLAPTPGTPAESDVWYHPLPGPKRTLPERDTRRFGAAREGMRPEECEGGHCGVDIGTETGMLVLASHDGVVERVERDPEVGGRRGNEGRFIRVLHKGGTVITSYIHLDAIREDLRPGIPVRAGEAIGTVGDTGVQHSGPHLHFAISVRPSAEGSELYINPEPLLILWPLAKRPAATLHAMTNAVVPHPKTAKADGRSDL